MKLKTIMFMFTLLFTQLLFAETKLLHSNCKIAIDHSYTNDGLNEILSSAAGLVLGKKGFTLVDMNEALSSGEDAMAIKIELAVTTKKSRGKCSATVALRGTLDESMSSMQLVSTAKKTGSLEKVSSKCVAQIVSKLKEYPKCTTLKPVEDETPLPDEDTPSNDQGSEA